MVSGRAWAFSYTHFCSFRNYEFVVSLNAQQEYTSESPVLLVCGGMMCTKTLTLFSRHLFQFQLILRILTMKSKAMVKGIFFGRVGIE